MSEKGTDLSGISLSLKYLGYGLNFDTLLKVYLCGGQARDEHGKRLLDVLSRPSKSTLHYFCMDQEYRLEADWSYDGTAKLPMS